MMESISEGEKISAEKDFCKYLFDIRRQLWQVSAMIFGGGAAGVIYPSFRSVCIGVVLGALLTAIQRRNPHE